MPRVLRSALPVLLATALLSGCMGLLGGNQGGGYSSGSSGHGASLVVVNNASQPVYYLYASSCSNSNWGPDRLDDDQVIMPGDTVSFTMTTGCWDLRAVFRDGTDVVRRNAQISASDWRWTIG